MNRYWAMLAICIPCSLFAATAQTIEVSKNDRESVTLTIYNNNFALVHDVRQLRLPDGLLELRYRDVAKQIDPSSVMIDTDSDPLQVREQNYRYDLLNKESLLERYIGRKLKYTRTVLEDDHYEKVLREGILLSSDPEIVKFGDEIEISPQGTISLAYIPESLSARPTLVWRVNNPTRGRRTLETTYITAGVTWRADHSLLLNEDEGKLNLTTWVTVDNNSGASWEDAALRLVAGEVRRAPANMDMARHEPKALAMRASAPAPVSSVDEYHVYTMPRKTTLANNESKQLHLLSAQDLDWDREYIFESGSYPRQDQGVTEQNASVRLTLYNREETGPGMPLPAGKARVYNIADHGTPTLIGESRVGNTPVGEDLVITTGKAFDLVSERRQTLFRRLGERSSEVGYEITVRNRKDEPVTVTVLEHLFGDWTIVQQSHDSERRDAGTLKFELELDTGETQTISYRARIDR